MGNDRFVGPQVLPSLHNPVQLSVRPEYGVLKYGQGMGMQQVVVVGDHLVSTSTIIVTEVDEVELRVGKIDPFVGYIQSQTVWPVNFCAYNDGTLSAVHADTLETWVFAPISPEQPPFKKNI